MKQTLMKKALVLVTLVVGILLALQIRSFEKIKALGQRLEPQDIFAELRLLQLANGQLRQQLLTEEKDLQELQGSISNVSVQQQIKTLKLLSGQEAVSGEGVEITIGKEIREFWISDLVAHLVTVGAEAFAVNDIRLTSKNAGLRSVGGGLVVHHYFLRPPFKITVIGPGEDLQRAITQNGGIIDRMESAHPGLQVIVAKRDKVIIPALTE